jgi:ERF superfamily protein
MQKEHEANVAKRAFIQAKVALKKMLPAWLPRDKEVKFQDVRYTHTSLAAAMDIIQPNLNEFGFSLSWKTATNPKDGKVIVTAVLEHEAGHSEETTLEAAPDMKGSKSGGQGVASTVTVLMRYTGLALLGLTTADMKEDGDEHEVAPEAGRVDTKRNMKALREIVEKGKTKEDAEKLVNRPFQKWTLDDLNKLRNWIRPAAAEAAPEPEEPPAEEETQESAPAPDPSDLPPPPATPKDGDRWEEVVQVIEIKDQSQPGVGPYVTLKLRHAGGTATEHNSNDKKVAQIARAMMEKEELVKVGFVCKINKEKRVFVNVETMELYKTNIPF